MALQTLSGWTQLSAGQNFTQEDVEMNRLWYTHVVGANAAGFKGHDSFRFVLSDLDNETPPQSFFISVHTVQKGQRSQLEWFLFCLPSNFGGGKFVEFSDEPMLTDANCSVLSHVSPWDT